MPVVVGREYRSFDALDASEDEYVVEGYATTFGDPYELGSAHEAIDRHALDAADMSDVIFQYDHAGLVMARMSNGSLIVSPDDHGLRIRADLSGSQAGRDLCEAIRNKLVTRMSWGFTIADDGWTWDAQTRTATVKAISKVFDVSAVSIPANGSTEIKSCRSYLDGVIEAERRESLRRERVRAAVAARMRLSKREGL